MFNYASVVDARNRDEVSDGLRPNVTRNRDLMLAAAMVADHHGVDITVTDQPNRFVYRSYITVGCYICGNVVANGGWQFEHIADDGNGVAGDELVKAIVNGTQELSGVHFGCGTCNAAKNAERAYRNRIAKAGQ